MLLVLGNHNDDGVYDGRVIWYTNGKSLEVGKETHRSCGIYILYARTEFPGEASILGIVIQMDGYSACASTNRMTWLCML